MVFVNFCSSLRFCYGKIFIISGSEGINKSYTKILAVRSEENKMDGNKMKNISKQNLHGLGGRF